MSEQRKRGTNVGNINLPAASATSTRGAAAKSTLLESGSASAAHAGRAFEATACGRGVAEPRLGLSVFADVYESAHEVLVAESRYGVLRLLPSGVLHDTTALHPSKSRQPPSFSRSKPAIIKYL
jgi:hypothetical protein